MMFGDSHRVFILVTLCIGLFISNACAEEEGEFDFPKIFDYSVYAKLGWNGNVDLDGLGFHIQYDEITPVLRPGYYNDVTDVRYHYSYNAIVEDNRPAAFFASYSDDSSNGQDIDDIEYALNNIYVQGLDYAFMDFEGDFASETERTSAIINLVRNHSNPAVNTARIGNYDYYPGVVDVKNGGDRTAEHNYYLSSGLTVAMPSCYPYEYYSLQTYYGGAPNNRSALFWGPLEKFSEAKRALPEGHEIIPWVNNYVSCDYGSAAPSPKEDNYELLRHMRLRGADGYYIWRTCDDPDTPDYHYDNNEYRGDMLEAWVSLDFLFDNDAEVTFLNLDTDKVSGVQWSAAINDRGEFAYVISNLGNEWEVLICPVELRSLLGFDSISVAPGSHVYNHLQLPEPASLILLTAGMGVMIRKRRRHIS